MIPIFMSDSVAAVDGYSEQPGGEFCFMPKSLGSSENSKQNFLSGLFGKSSV